MTVLFRKGRSVLGIVQAHGWRALAQRLLRRPHPVRMHIETPLDGGYALGSIAVRGWVFSQQGEISRVEVVHQGKVIAALSHNQPRPDVSDHFAFRGALYSGFDGTVMLPAGRQTILIRATDVDGNTFSTRLRLLCGETPPAQLVIERAAWQGSTLSIEGWALWVSSDPPRILRYFLNGKLLGESRCNVSRPEISGRYSPEIAAHCRGFTFTHAVVPTTQPAHLRVVIQDRSGRTLEQTIAVQHAGQGTVANHAELEQQLALYRAAVNPAPEILDLNTGLKQHFPAYNIFTPPTNDPRLPYFDKSVDIVLYTDASFHEEAHRVARGAVFHVCDAFAVEWKDAPPQLARVSIIIPVYNRSDDTRTCLDQLRQTLPPYFNGEVIVADDASTDDTPTMLAAYAANWSPLKTVHSEQNSGFVLNCNRGAQVATGDYLLFLNNDTLPQPGWFEALLMTFTRDSQAGVVGGKLINADGTLQEAGSIVFADGRTLNFGAHDPAVNHPLYQHVREVDYCSGVLLMTLRALFNQVGGFDPQFQPAYFEDVDYCFQVRALGYQVLYQPESVVIHAGHVSYTDFTQHTDQNRAKFVQKWAAALAQHPTSEYDPYTLVDVHRRRRVLFYGNRMPEFDRFGGLLRFHYLINALLDSGWAVTFYGRDITGAERYADLLRQRGVMVYGGDLSRAIDDNYLPDPTSLIQSAHFDLAVLSLWQTAEPLIPLLRAHSPKTQIIVDSSDVHFVREARARFAEHKELDSIFARGMIGELNVYAAADAMLAVSENEATIVNSLIGVPEHAQVVPNMIEMTPSPYAFSERRGIVFIGNYLYPPNVEAVSYLIEQVLPLFPVQLLAEHPLLLIGHHAQEALGVLVAGHEHVRLIGWLPDASPYLQRARIVVAPLLNGAGTKTKLITALANRTPVVSTWIGAEGLGVQHEKELLIADTAQEFANAMQRLLTDEALWQRLAAAGYDHIQATHGYEVGKRRFVEVINTVLGRASSSG